MADIDWGQIINGAAQLAGNYAASRANARTNQNLMQQGQDRSALAGYQTDKSSDLMALVQAYQAQLDRSKGQLDEYKTALDAPGRRADNAVRGDILAGVQDVSIDAPAGVRMPKISGGLRPSLLSADSRKLGSLMTREALLDQMSGAPKPYSSLKDLDVSEITSRKAPEPTPLQEPSTMDAILNNIALASAGAGAVYGAMQPTPVQGKPLPTGAGQTPPAPQTTPVAGQLPAGNTGWWNWRI